MPKGLLSAGYYEDIYQKVGQQVIHKSWMAVPDYSVIKACGHTILCVGGTISVDRTEREKDDYWSDEAPVYITFLTL